MRLRLLGCAAVAVALACSLLIPAPAAADEEWSPTEALSAPFTANDTPRLLATAGGTLTAAWTTSAGGPTEPHGLVIRTKPAGRTWTPEQVLDPNASGRLNIALDRDDRVVAGYVDSRGQVAHAITQAADGTFGDPVPLAPQLDGWVRDIGGGPFLAMSEQGQQAIVWIQQTPGNKTRVVAVRRDSSDNAWSTPKFLTPASRKPKDLAAAAANGGAVAALWTEGPAPQRMKFRELTAEGTWTATELAARHDYGFDLQLVHRGDGRVTALWINIVGVTDALEHAYSVTRTRTGKWTRIMPIEVVDRGEQAHTLTSNGRVTAVVWTRLPKVFDGKLRLFGRVQNGRTWGQPKLLRRPRGGAVFFNDAAFGADGALRVVWFENHSDAVSRIREPGGTWGPLVAIDERSLRSGFTPSVAVWGDRRAGLLSTELDGVTYTERTD